MNIALETKGNFDRATGLWQFKFETTHKPMEQFDVNLIKNTRLRNIESCKDPEVALVKIQPSHTMKMVAKSSVDVALNMQLWLLCQRICNLVYLLGSYKMSIQ